MKSMKKKFKGEPWSKDRKFWQEVLVAFQVWLRFFLIGAAVLLFMEKLRG